MPYEALVPLVLGGDPPTAYEVGAVIPDAAFGDNVEGLVKAGDIKRAGKSAKPSKGEAVETAPQADDGVPGGEEPAEDSAPRKTAAKRKPAKRKSAAKKSSTRRSGPRT